jgi:hypothetical protein
VQSALPNSHKCGRAVPIPRSGARWPQEARMWFATPSGWRRNTAGKVRRAAAGQGGAASHSHCGESVRVGAAAPKPPPRGGTQGAGRRPPPPLAERWSSSKYADTRRTCSQRWQGTVTMVRVKATVHKCAIKPSPTRFLWASRVAPWPIARSASGTSVAPQWTLPQTRRCLDPPATPTWRGDTRPARGRAGCPGKAFGAALQCTSC